MSTPDRHTHLATRPRPPLRRSGPRPRVRDESGTALLLVPVGILLVMILAAITVDSAMVFLGERAAFDSASGAANDLAAISLDEGAYRADGSVRPRTDLPRLAESIVPAVETATRGSLVPGSVRVSVRALDRGRVEVVVSGRVRRIFVGIIPGVAREVEVTARAVAVLDLIEFPRHP